MLKNNDVNTISFTNFRTIGAQLMVRITFMNSNLRMILQNTHLSVIWMKI